MSNKLTSTGSMSSVVATAVSGTVLIAAGAFWLSFTSLADLARRSGIAPQQAWAWPLIVDGIIVVATVAVVALSPAARPRATWYPWLLLASGAAVSVAANALHAVIAADASGPPSLQQPVRTPASYRLRQPHPRPRRAPSTSATRRSNCGSTG